MYCDQCRYLPALQFRPLLAKFQNVTVQRWTASFVLSCFCAVTGLTTFHSVGLAQDIITDGIIDEPVKLSVQADLAAEPAAISGSCGGGEYQSSNPDYEAQIVQLVNQIRIDHGMLPLKRVSALDSASRFHATDMSVDDYFSHISYDRIDGELVESCQWNKRIRTYYKGGGSLAENIAAGYQQPEAVVEAWMDSEGHRANILATDNWEIGVGYFQGSGKYTHYWVQDFGKRDSVYPIILDGEATTTSTGAVIVHLYGSWEEVRLRTDDQNWSGWMPFQSEMPWQIVGTEGKRTVHAEMRSGSQTVTSNDSIYLTQSSSTLDFADLPDKIAFVYNVQEKQLSPSAHVIKPIADAADGYTWQAVVKGSWLNISRVTGKDLDTFEVRPVVSSASGVTPGTATVELSFFDADGTVVDNHSISVSLQVLSGPLNDLYVPTVMH